MEEIQRRIIVTVTELRKSRGDKQVDLAAALDLSRSFIADVESFRSSYNLVHLNKIALHYNCRLYDLIPEYPIE